jgi:hypothetical protein
MRDTIDMAREADFFENGGNVYGDHTNLKAFEALVRADQREIDAKVCEDGVQNANDWDSSYWDQACENRAAAIRERSSSHSDSANAGARGNT